MSDLIVWGDKLKSSIDNSTVDQEIDDKIQSHKDDPDAHLDAGGILDSHVAAEVIDHSINSIVADKLSRNFFDDYVFACSFQSLDGFDVHGMYTDFSFGCVIIQPTFYINDYAYLSAKILPGLELNYDLDPILEFSFKMYEQGNYIAYCGMGDTVGLSVEATTNFKIVNGTLYARMKNAVVGTERLVEISNIDVSEYHKYRIEYIHGVGAKYYIDGSLVAEIDHPDHDNYFPTTPFFAYTFNSVGNNGTFMYVKPFTLRYALPRSQSGVSFSASGGTVTYSGNRTIHTFPASGYFYCNKPIRVDYVIVGGGSGGAAGVSGVNFGSGGAGGVLRSDSDKLLFAGNHPVTVGQGGARLAFGSGGLSGSGGFSCFNDVTANGGVGVGNSMRKGGANNDHVGGTGKTDYKGGGGAGAGANGSSHNGGGGAHSSISGADVGYGGGGGSYGATAGSGSVSDGGGASHGSASNGDNGTNGKGGGGGGGSASTLAGNGGSGVVIISYVTPS